MPLLLWYTSNATFTLAHFKCHFYFGTFQMPLLLWYTSNATFTLVHFKCHFYFGTLQMPLLLWHTSNATFTLVHFKCHFYFGTFQMPLLLWYTSNATSKQANEYKATKRLVFFSHEEKLLLLVCSHQEFKLSTLFCVCALMLY